jgi:hypothetical protein
MVAEVLDEHVTLQDEGIDRMYLNVYVLQLQREQGVPVNRQKRRSRGNHCPVRQYHHRRRTAMIDGGRIGRTFPSEEYL